MISGILKYISIVIVLGISGDMFAENVPLELNFLVEPPISVMSSQKYTELSMLLYSHQENSDKEVSSNELTEFYLSGNLEYFNDLSTICRGILFHSFSLYHESKLFFFEGNDNLLKTDVGKLSAALENVFPLYINLLENYYIFIDRYREDDWFARFGYNGVYQRIKALREESVLLKAAWILYLQNSEKTFSDKISFDIGQVSNDLIKLYVDTKQTIYLIWWYKINYRSGLFANPVQCYEEMSKTLDQSTVAFIDTIELLLLKNEVFLESGTLGFSECLDSIHSLRVKLEEAQLLVKDKEVLLFRLALYESYLCYNYINKSSSLNEGDSNPLQIGTGCYQELMRIAIEYPAISERIYKYISYNNYFLLEQTDLDQWQKYLMRWDQPVVYQTALYYKKMGISEYDKVLTLFKAIEASGDKGVIAKMLYCRGFCFLELAENTSDMDKAGNYYRNAINDFVVLLRDIDFNPQDYQQGQNILQGLLLSVRQLYENGDSKQWLLDTLTPPIEKIINNKNVSIGLSNSSDVSLLCYYYSLILEDIKEYNMAVKYFSHVSEKQLARAVEFHMAYCKYQVIKETEIEGNLYNDVIMPLNSLVSSSPECDIIAVNAAVMLSEACLDSGQIDVYLKTVPQVLEAVEKESASELVRFAQKFVLAYMDDSFMLKVSEGDSPWIIKKLNKIKLLVSSMYIKSSGDEVPLSAVLYSRYISFQISSCTSRRQIIDLISNHADLLRELAEHIESGHLEKVRNQAILDMASGDYESAREQWFKVRSSDNAKDSYFYWESRYWGIYCQMLNGDSSQAMHSVDVLLAENELADKNEPVSRYVVLWLQRIRHMDIQ